MRTWKMRIWMCVAVLCCAMSAAFCQTLSGSLAAGTGLPPDAPRGGGGMGSIEARSQVSASASSTMNADVAASMDAEGVSGAVAYGGGAGAGSARLDFRVGPSANFTGDLNKPVDGRLGLGPERGQSGRRILESKRKESTLSARTTVRNGTTQAERRLSKQVSRTRNSSANKPAATTMSQSGAVYSKDFPDSTKGTALLSPPDSTGSPLNWTPGMSFGFRDLAEQTFLKPNLQGGYSLQKKRVAARTRAPATGSIPSDALTYPDLSTSLGDSLRVGVPDPLVDLQSH